MRCVEERLGVLLCCCSLEEDEIDSFRGLKSMKEEEGEMVAPGRGFISSRAKSATLYVSFPKKKEWQMLHHVTLDSQGAPSPSATRFIRITLLSYHMKMSDENIVFRFCNYETTLMP